MEWHTTTCRGLCDEHKKQFREGYVALRPSEILALRWGDIDFRENFARVSKAQSKGRLNNCTKVSEVRDVRLNDRTLHALAMVKPFAPTVHSYVFRSQRYNAGFKIERIQLKIFTYASKQLDIRHRKTYNNRHTYATMFLMAGVNIHFAASQLGHSPIMTAIVYAKWISGDADKTEMEKLKTEISEQKTERETAKKRDKRYFGETKMYISPNHGAQKKELVGTAGFELVR